MRVDGHLNLTCLWCSVSSQTPTAILQFYDLLSLFLESWIERCLNESENKRYSSHTSLGNVSNDESKCLKLILPWHPRHSRCPDGRAHTSSTLVWGKSPGPETPEAFMKYPKVLVCNGEYNAVRWMLKPRPLRKLAVYTIVLSQSPEAPLQWCSSWANVDPEWERPLCEFVSEIVVSESLRSWLSESKKFLLDLGLEN